MYDDIYKRIEHIKSIVKSVSHLPTFQHENHACIVCGVDINETMSNVCSIICFDEWVMLNS